jgi:hypothetical protein
MPRDVRPEDMAALLDAFSGPSDDAALADIPRPAALESPADPVEDLLEGIPVREAPPVEGPLAAARGETLHASTSPGRGSGRRTRRAGQRFGTPPALTRKSPSRRWRSPPEEEPVLEDAILDAAEPGDELEFPLTLEGEAEPSPSAGDEDLLAGVLPPEETPSPAGPPPTRPLLEIPGLKQLLAAARPGGPERATSRTRTKFQAAAPKRSAPAEGGLDLGPARPSPRERAPPTGREGRQSPSPRALRPYRPWSAAVGEWPRPRAMIGVA